MFCPLFFSTVEIQENYHNGNTKVDIQIYLVVFKAFLAMEIVCYS